MLFYQKKKFRIFVGGIEFASYHSLVHYYVLTSVQIVMLMCWLNLNQKHM